MRTSRLLPIILAATALLALPGCSRVKDDWKAAQGADTSEAYQDFLQQHPDSEFAVQAQSRLKQLAEDRDWQQAAATDTFFVETIARGRRGTGMVGFAESSPIHPTLTRADIESIVSFIRTWGAQP